MHALRLSLCLGAEFGDERSLMCSAGDLVGDGYSRRFSLCRG